MTCGPVCCDIENSVTATISQLLRRIFFLYLFKSTFYLSSQRVIPDQLNYLSDSLHFSEYSLKYGIEGNDGSFFHCGDFVGGCIRSGSDIGSGTVAGPRRGVLATCFRRDCVLLADLVRCRSSQELDRSLLIRCC
ncbi:hypothetical protein HAX54_029476 [Datura stramonium]|uniref:Uncharacterized protein n=1 Tax=Datura stramonium TaxID=4076 RepID=A0ABS8V8L6_DATST|nr:hypothetical protein [Datura stramonium]